MQQNLTAAILFIITTFLAAYLFYRASNKSNTSLIIIFGWMIIQSVISLTGFYFNEFTKPPRFIALGLPPVVFIIILFSTTKGKVFINKLNIRWLTVLQSIRILVEIVLYMLFISKSIPQIMTFEGRNFDILAGISAPIVYYLAFKKQTLSKKLLLIWNILSLLLLFNIVVIAALSLQTTLQQFALDQPNIALTYFPFIWLPSVVVPIVLLSHLASLKQILSYSKNLLTKNG